ncbi:uncharacterized protein [Apostichopus japonicus]|uniref:uncharacterized protein isoform X2 n=1 Tax=Stichopus japonicus TaxID=307972 RepID=UPI003AB7593A
MWRRLRSQIGTGYTLLCLVIGNVITAYGVQIVSVKEGGSVTLDCGVKTTEVGRNLKWDVLTNGQDAQLAFNVDGTILCNIELNDCTLYPNGSIVLRNLTVEDGGNTYRCQLGDETGYKYYSDHLLTVSSGINNRPFFEGQTHSSIAFAEPTGVIYAYSTPSCKDVEDGVLSVSCTPLSGVLVYQEYKYVTCSCTDSEGEISNLQMNVTKHGINNRPFFEGQTHSSIAIEEPTGVIYAYSTPSCKDVEDGVLSVSCTPLSGVLVYQEYKYVTCSCTDSEGEMCNLQMNVTKHGINNRPFFEGQTHSSIAFAEPTGVIYAYSTPSCKDVEDGVLSVSCTPLSGVLVYQEYKYVTCSCTDSEGEISNLQMNVTKHGINNRPFFEGQTHSSIAIEEPTGVIYAYSTPSCKDVEDGVLSVSCTPLSGVLVYQEYKYVTCSCTDSEGEMCNLQMNVTKHGINNRPFFEGQTYSSIAFEEPTGVIYAYITPSCKDVEDGVLSVSCTPLSGVLVYQEYKYVTCSCTDSEGEMSNFQMNVTKHDSQTGLPPAASIVVCTLLVVLLIITVVLACLLQKIYDDLKA